MRALAVAILLGCLVLGGSPAHAQAQAPASGGALRPFDTGTAAALGKTYAGRPYILALWSVTCEPCRQDMPHWGPLQRRHPGVPILLVATDPPSDRALVEKMLAQYDLGRVERWMFADDYVERLRYAIDPRWRGELPRTYLVDAARRTEAISGVVDPAKLEAWMARQGAGRRQ
jgi:hypothetical protein